MSRNYTKEQILDILYSANKDINDTIGKYVNGCLNRNEKKMEEARQHGFGILTPLQQSITCVIDFIEMDGK